RCRQDDVRDRYGLDQNFEHRALEVLGGDAQVLGRVPLRIEVDQQDPVAQLGEAVGVGHREAGLAGAALEVEEELAARRLPARVAVQHPAVRRQVPRLIGRVSAAEGLQLGHLVRGGQLLVSEAQELGEVAALITDVHYDARWRGSWLRRIRWTMRRTWGSGSPLSGSSSGRRASPRAPAAASTTRRRTCGFASAIPQRTWGSSRAGSRSSSRPSDW